MKINPIILAIDLNSLDEIISILNDIQLNINRIKLGLEFFYHNGLGGIYKIIEKFPHIKIFLDLKFYDIPTTVKKSLYAFSDFSENIEFMTFHSSGGTEMLIKSKEILKNIMPKTKILAVTKLTSFELNKDEIFELAKMSILDANCDGLIAPASMSLFLKSNIKKDFLVISPGIRFEEDDKNDQKTIMTPKSAISSGVDFLVIGRPIMNFSNKNERILKILESLKN